MWYRERGLALPGDFFAWLWQTFSFALGGSPTAPFKKGGVSQLGSLGSLSMGSKLYSSGLGAAAGCPWASHSYPTAAAGHLGWVPRSCRPTPLAPSTTRAYERALTVFISFSSWNGFADPWPASEALLLQYLAHLRKKDLNPKTMGIHLSAIIFYSKA